MLISLVVISRSITSSTICKKGSHVYCAMLQVDCIVWRVECAFVAPSISDNNLGAKGVQALVPALQHLTGLQQLYLRRES